MDFSFKEDEAKAREVEAYDTWHLTKNGGWNRRAKKDTLGFHYPRGPRHYVKYFPSNVEAHNFELKLALISIMQEAQFRGTPMKDLRLHLPVFLEVCDTLKLNEVSIDAIPLWLFSFSLKD